MRYLLAILLAVGMSRAQNLPMELHLPDTSFRLSSVEAIELELAKLLSSDGLAGKLDTRYQLDSLWLEGIASAQLHMQYGKYRATVPAADTIIVVADKNGTVAIAPRLMSSLSTGNRLTSGGKTAYLIRSRQFFYPSGTGGKGYGMLQSLTDVSRKSIEILAAYDDRGTQGSQIVGQLRLDLQNIMGTLRALKLELERLDGQNQTMLVDYSEPVLPLLNIGGRFKFDQEVRDSLYVRRDLVVQAVALPGSPLYTALGIGWKSLTVSDHGEQAGLVAYSSQNINLALGYDNFDNRENPRRGWGFEFAGEAGTVDGVDTDDRAALGSGELNLTWAMGISRFANNPVVILQQIHLAGVKTIAYTAQLADQVKFGGTGNIRGYREEQFIGNWGITMQNELRLLTGKASNFHLLGDFGIVDARDRLAALGLGIAVPLGNTQLQLDFAWSGADDFGAGKMHLKLVNYLSDR
ncbi:hypothetical protein ACFL6E_06015 [Candidatus Neomarinimicrobiota bacterium]